MGLNTWSSVGDAVLWITYKDYLADMPWLEEAHIAGVGLESL